jgi:hypothetical protein
MVTHLREMLVERLLLYEKKSKKLPERVFVFRDGVSEVRLRIVLPIEVHTMTAAVT